MKKRFLGLLCAMMLMLSCAVCAAQPADKLGDTMEDFPVTLADGTTTTLYETLEGKDAVLLNFWASWCSPCRMEFPAMHEAWERMSGEIGLLALSTEPTDTAERITQFAAENGIAGLPMGRDDGMVYARFGVNSIPLNVMVDSSGTICFIRTGAVFDAADFERLFSVFTAEDYAEPALLTDIPPVPLPDAADGQTLAGALGAGDSGLTFGGLEGFWPMLPAQEGVYASNHQQDNTSAALTVNGEAKAGDVLVYEVMTSGEPVYDHLMVYLNDTPVDMHSGSMDTWTQGSVRIEQDGVFLISFIAYNSYASADAACALRGVRLLAGGEAAAFVQDAPAYPRAMEGSSASCEAAGDGVKMASFCVGGTPVEELEIYKLAYVSGDSADFRILLGEACSPQFGALVMQNDAGERGYLMSSLPRDDRGLLFTADLSAAAQAAYLDVYPSCFEPVVQRVIITRRQEIADAVLQELIMIGLQSGLISEGDAQSACLMTPEGEVIAAAAQEESAAQEQSAGECRYEVVCVDEAGGPVAGAMIQLCDDTLCVMLTTDEDGRASHTAPEGDYEAHVLMAPEGYEGTEEIFALPRAGGEIVITLRRK